MRGGAGRNVQFLFDNHTLDIERRELRRGGEPIGVQPQVFDLLVYLVQNRDRVVSKDDLIASVWGGRIVSDSTLTSRINAARKAIGDSGEAVLELWCKGGKGQFSVAGNTVIFVAGELEDRACPPARAQADDDLVAALGEAATWQRQGDFVSFIGAKTLRFRLDTN